ncbi:MAG: carbamoyl-phosphate synthase (glutamine-hydrolyzing) large subunit [Planctomycetota bacterium]|nr:carbamoyl-phosphate synthase (glutamine-hydrolyzing) large subunit [Planctomycetota bacterium]
MKQEVKKVLVLGSGAIKIGEAGEFDYSGSQAIKAFKEKGIEVVLVNPNIATVQTDSGFANKVYFLPVDLQFVKKVIEREKPDSLAASFGGQTALNCAVALASAGVLDKYNVRVLGTPVETIKDTEDRERFAQKLREMGVPTPEGATARRVEDGVKIAAKIGYPVMVRAGYALGGRGSGVAHSEKELLPILKSAFRATEQVLIEPYLGGWREVEYEVMRDSYDNCLIICNMENFDPMGIHTGESIVVAPSQTLTNEEYHTLREVSIKVVRRLGIVGECNIQFALSHNGKKFYVIEVNARLSRSSALASKATGYPIAYVAAHLALGDSLIQLRNKITGVTSACFEPALDYCVVKIPRWDMKKFSYVDNHIGTEMKSVGEVMAIGRVFEEAFQKALRMTEATRLGFETTRKFENLDDALKNPTPERVFAIGAAFREGYSTERIFELTGIAPFFIERLRRIFETEKKIKSEGLTTERIAEAKRLGFSDLQLATFVGKTEAEIRSLRKRCGIEPYVKQIDTLAAEYPAQTNYLYFTYNASADDIERTSLDKRKSVLVIGSGHYRIGSSVEFDWCCVECVRKLRQLGYRAIMLNCNPETVSTDYDECDALYFDELSLERVLDVCEFESPLGVVVSMGGQIPNSLALPLHKAGVRILGTGADSIDSAENRKKFSSLLDELKVEQPEWTEATDLKDALAFARSVGYPVLVRPSYVLSGASMRLAYDDKQLEKFIKGAADISPEHPVVVSKFIEGAKEIEFDGVAQNGEIKLYAISEHIEDAGVHSGDATIILPAQRIYVETQRRIKVIAQRIAERLKISGPFNIQFIAKENRIKIIELNLRASRTFPFVSKVYNRNFATLAVEAIMGYPVERTRKLEVEYVAVKAAQFSFERLKGADPVVGVEMASTGEVACFGETVEEAFLKALRATGFPQEVKGLFIDITIEKERFRFLEVLTLLNQKRSVKLYAPEPLYHFLKYHGCEVKRLEYEDVENALLKGEISVMIHLPPDASPASLEEGYKWRRQASDLSVPVMTNPKQARLFLMALISEKLEQLPAYDWSHYCG